MCLDLKERKLNLFLFSAKNGIIFYQISSLYYRKKSKFESSFSGLSNVSALSNQTKMEEIFANPGLQLIAERICHFLTPKSFQNLILTSKSMMSYSANNFQTWFMKCQKAKLFTDKNLIKWKDFVKFILDHEMEWNLGIIFKYLYYNRYSESSNIYHELKQDPFKIVSFLGQTKLIKLLLEKRKLFLISYLPGNVYSIEWKKYFMDCVSRSISIQGNISKTGTFKAFQLILKILLLLDRLEIEKLVPKLVPVAQKSCSAEILKILSVFLDPPNTLGQRPMHMLAFKGNVKENIEVVRFVGAICGDILNEEDVFGTTPMHIAAEHGHLEFVKVLIPYWNNPMAKNEDNKTAVEIAEEKEHHEIAKILKTRNEHECRRISDVYLKGK